jgi:peptidoglycan/LPS O-acetylase OafA/YrhL
MKKKNSGRVKVNSMSTRSSTENPLQASSGKSARLFFLDHLRAALVILVVLHHVALVYGAGAPFYYAEPPLTDPAAFRALLVFILFNQAWFMGALFLLAGCFTPASCDRKGPGGFIKGRLLRLGVPLIFFYFVLHPLASVGFWQMPSELTGITAPLTWGAYPRLLGMGPMWFAALLLVFDIGYAVWRVLTAKRKTTHPANATPPGYLSIGVFVLTLALAGYLMRTVVPMGEDVIGFPTLSYLPQYIALFAVGAFAARRDMFRTLPGAAGIAGFAAAAAASVLLFPVAFSGRMFSLQIADPAPFVGNGHWQSAVYALWDSILAVGLCQGAVTLFRRFFNRPGRFGKFLSQHSYAVYIIHVPAVVFLAVAVKAIQLEPLMKFGLVSIVAVPVCFAATFVIRKIPGVARVI